MTLLRILTFAIRICGIFLFIDGFVNLGFTAIPFVQSGLALEQFSSYLVIHAVFLIIYILMIFIPVPIAKLLLPRVEIVAGFTRRPIENLEVIGCSLIGIYLFTDAVADLSYLITLYQKSGVSEGEGSS